MKVKHQIFNIKILWAFIFILFFFCVIFTPMNLAQDFKILQHKNIEDIYEKYLNNLKEGNLKGAENCWNKEEVKLYKFYDFSLAPPHNLKQEISAHCIGYDHEIVESNVYGNHCITKYKYTLKDQFRDKWKAPLNFHEFRYFIKEKKQWTLANPIKIITQNWNYHETTYLKFHFPKDITPLSSFYQNLDTTYINFASLFNFETQVKPLIYLCHPNQLERLSTVKGQSASGRNFPENNLLIVIFEKRKSTKELPEINTNLCAHELLHVLAYKTFNQDKRLLPFLREGLSVTYAGTGGIPAEVTFSWAKYAISQNKNPGLAALNNPKIFYSKINRHYALAGSFIKFIIERYGIEKFKTFYIQFTEQEIFGEVLKENYNKTIAEIEPEWIEFVKNYPLTFDKKWSQFTLQFIEK